MSYNNILQEKINNLNIFQKFEIYMDYYINMSTMKHSFISVKKDKPNWKNGYGKPDEEDNHRAKFYLWKNIKIPTLDEFISEKNNIIITDNGDNWKENGYAQKIRIEYRGIFDWYRKFENKFQKLPLY